jgi:hypothetical protein
MKPMLEQLSEEESLRLAAVSIRPAHVTGRRILRG